jgi:hypothetical protein
LCVAVRSLNHLQEEWSRALSVRVVTGWHLLILGLVWWRIGEGNGEMERH